MSVQKGVKSAARKPAKPRRFRPGNPTYERISFRAIPQARTKWPREPSGQLSGGAVRRGRHDRYVRRQGGRLPEPFVGHDGTGASRQRSEDVPGAPDYRRLHGGNHYALSGRSESRVPRRVQTRLSGRPPGMSPAAKKDLGSTEEGMQVPNWKSRMEGVQDPKWKFCLGL